MLNAGTAKVVVQKSVAVSYCGVYTTLNNRICLCFFGYFVIILWIGVKCNK